MSYQVMIIPNDPLELVVKYARLKTSSHFNTRMYRHYRHLYHRYRRGWRFTKCAFAFFKMLHYEKEMYQARVNELLNELNQPGNGRTYSL